MVKATTKLNPQDRVILFCTATGIDIARPRPAAGYDGPGLVIFTDECGYGADDNRPTPHWLSGSVPADTQRIKRAPAVPGLLVANQRRKP